MALRLNHEKGSGAASLTSVVPWARPGDFSVSVLNISIFVSVHALLSIVPEPCCIWCVRSSLLPVKASCDIPADKS